ncbi:MAG: NAD-binding protein, partial [Desulfamplus sp.]|nr:NAD-binding protein [Desulfamplus sp.]
SVLSMVLTPFASAMAAPIYKFKKRRSNYETLQTENLPSSEFSGHVVIAGGGRVGQHIARVLTKLQIPFIIIELDHQRMVECKEAKYPVIYGDMTHQTVLEVSKVESATLLLITTPSVTIAQAIVKLAHFINPGLRIIVRTDGVEQTRELYESGVYMAVMPEMEAGLEIARPALLQLEIPVAVIQEYSDAVRQQLYAPIYQSEYDNIASSFDQDRKLLAKLDNIKNVASFISA